MRLEDEVDVYPVVGLLVERVRGERVADVEYVAVDTLCGFGGEVGCEGVVWGYGGLVVRMEDWGGDGYRRRLRRRPSARRR